MVVITSGCATYEPWAAAIGGIIGGLVVVPGGWFMLHVCKVDDPVDAFTVSGTLFEAVDLTKPPHRLPSRMLGSDSRYGAAPEGMQHCMPSRGVGGCWPSYLALAAGL